MYTSTIQSSEVEPLEFKSYGIYAFSHCTNYQASNVFVVFIDQGQIQGVKPFWQSLNSSDQLINKSTIFLPLYCHITLNCIVMALKTITIIKLLQLLL